MARSSIVNVLGCLTLITVISGCSSMPQPITVSAKPIEKPELILPASDQLFQRKIEWVILTPENIEEQFEKVKKSGRSIAIFGVTDEGYQNLSLNLSDLRAYIQQQQAIVAAYEGYYQASEDAIEDANDSMKEAKTKAEEARDEEENAPIWKKLFD